MPPPDGLQKLLDTQRDLLQDVEDKFNTYKRHNPIETRQQEGGRGGFARKGLGQRSNIVTSDGGSEWSRVEGAGARVRGAVSPLFASAVDPTAGWQPKQRPPGGAKPTAGAKFEVREGDELFVAGVEGVLERVVRRVMEPFECRVLSKVDAIEDTLVGLLKNPPKAPSSPPPPAQPLHPQPPPARTPSAPQAQTQTQTHTPVLRAGGPAPPPTSRGVQCSLDATPPPPPAPPRTTGPRSVLPADATSTGDAIADVGRKLDHMSATLIQQIADVRIELSTGTPQKQPSGLSFRTCSSTREVPRAAARKSGLSVATEPAGESECDASTGGCGVAAATQLRILHEMWQAFPNIVTDLKAIMSLARSTFDATMTCKRMLDAAAGESRGGQSPNTEPLTARESLSSDERAAAPVHTGSRFTIRPLDSGSVSTAFAGIGGSTPSKKDCSFTIAGVTHRLSTSPRTTPRASTSRGIVSAFPSINNDFELSSPPSATGAFAPSAFNPSTREERITSTISFATPGTVVAIPPTVTKRVRRSLNTLSPATLTPPSVLQLNPAGGLPPPITSPGTGLGSQPNNSPTTPRRRKSIFKDGIRAHSIALSEVSLRSNTDGFTVKVPQCLAGIPNGHSARVLQALYRVLVTSQTCSRHDFCYQVARELVLLARVEEVSFGCGDAASCYPGVAKLAWVDAKTQTVEEYAQSLRRRVAADGTTTTLEVTDLTAGEIEASALYDAAHDALRADEATPAFVRLISIGVHDRVLGIVKFAGGTRRLQPPATAASCSKDASLTMYPCSKDMPSPFCTVGCTSGKAQQTEGGAAAAPGIAPEDMEAVESFLTFFGPMLHQYRAQIAATDELAMFGDIADVLTDIGMIDAAVTDSMQELIDLTIAGAGILVPSESITVFLCCNVPDTYVRDGTRLVTADLTSGLVPHAMQHRESVYTNDPMSHESFTKVFKVYDSGDEVRNVLCVPVVLEDGRVSGVIELLNRRHKAYDDNDVKRIESLAAYTASALRNHMSATALRSLHRQTSSLVSICRDLAAVSLHQHTLIERIMSQAQDLVSADHAALFIVDWRRKSLFCTLQGREHVVPLNCGLLGMVTNSGMPVNIQDVCTDSRIDHTAQTGFTGAVHSILAVPVRREGGEIVAVARVLNKRDEYGNPIAFTEADEQVLDMFSTFAGISLMISEQYKTAERDKARVRDMLDALVGMADTDIRTGPQQVCLTIMRYAKSLLVADRCVMYLVDKERSEFVCGAGKNAGERSVPLDCGVLGQVFRTGRTINLSNAAHAIVDDAIGSTNCLLAAPVKLQTEVVAVVCVTGKMGTNYNATFDGEDEETLEFFCTLAGIFINNAQLFEFATTGNTELNKVLVRLGNRGSSERDAAFRTSAKARGQLKEENRLFQHVTGMDGAQLERDINELPDHGFDVLRYVSRPDGLEEMIYMTAEMFRQRDLHTALALKRPTLVRLLARISVGYRKVPYHNVFHAFDVTQTLYGFIHRLAPSGLLTKLEEFTLLMCGLCHDIDHMGLNNSFHYKAETPLGILSNATGGSSPLEIHHLSYSMDILQQPEYNILAGIPDAGNEIAFYKSFVHLILGTDMAKHKDLCDRFGAVDPAAREHPEHRELLLTILLKAADVSNCTKPFDLSQAWARRVVEEFFFQGDKEQQQIGKISNDMFDRNSNKKIAETQLGFIRLVAKPFYQLVAKVFPELRHTYDQLLVNEERWASMNSRPDATNELADAMSRSLASASPRPRANGP